MRRLFPCLSIREYSYTVGYRWLPGTPVVTGDYRWLPGYLPEIGEYNCGLLGTTGGRGTTGGYRDIFMK